MNNAQSKVIGIFGNPIQHSKSPKMHNHVFSKLNLPYVYVPLETVPDQLQVAIEGFKAMGFHGANVTLPYKSKIMPYLDEVSELASLTESVNTIYWKDGKLRGTTTDGYGALKNLDANGVNYDNKHIAILGNGGSARAIAFQLARDSKNSKVTLVSRKRERGVMLADQLNHYHEGFARSITFEFYEEISSTVDIVINTTPLGLAPNVEESPLNADQLHSHQVVYDIVYNPLMTQLLKYADARGCKVVTGMGMLIYQGMKSFEYWTGEEAPEEYFFESLEHVEV